MCFCVSVRAGACCVCVSICISCLPQICNSCIYDSPWSHPKVHTFGAGHALHAVHPRSCCYGRPWSPPTSCCPWASRSPRTPRRSCDLHPIHVVFTFEAGWSGCTSHTSPLQRCQIALLFKSKISGLKLLVWDITRPERGNSYFLSRLQSP